QYYIAENKQYQGYDKTLEQGPYSFDYADSAPNKVDHFPYQDGLLVWYHNGLYSDNNTMAHPGGGQSLPVDANGQYSFWTIDGDPAYYASSNIEAFDATFDVDQTDALHLTRETPDGIANYDLDAHPGTPVFEDSDPNAYFDDLLPRTTQYSTQVSGLGT